VSRLTRIPPILLRAISCWVWTDINSPMLNGSNCNRSSHRKDLKQDFQLPTTAAASVTSCDSSVSVRPEAVCRRSMGPGARWRATLTAGAKRGSGSDSLPWSNTRPTPTGSSMGTFTTCTAPWDAPLSMRLGQSRRCRSLRLESMGLQHRCPSVRQSRIKGGN